METVDLLEKMKVSIDTMTTGEKFLASIQVTILGLVIVFAALAILYFAIIIMEKLIGEPRETVGIVKSKPGPVETAVLDDEKSVHAKEEDITHNTELIAVITAAIAASSHIPIQDVVVKSIKRVQDPTPIWARAGRMEQINNML